MGPQNCGFSLSDTASGRNHNPDAGSQSEGQSNSERDQSSRTYDEEASVLTLREADHNDFILHVWGFNTSLRCPGIASLHPS